MNAFEILRRDLELNSYAEDPIVDIPAKMELDINTRGRKYLSVSSIMTCGADFRGENAVPDIWAKRAQRFTLPEDDPYLLGWAYHLYTAGEVHTGQFYVSMEQLLARIAETEVIGFITYLQSYNLNVDKETLKIKNNANLRGKMRVFLERWNVGELERATTVYRLLNYMLLWNEIMLG